MIDQRIRDLAKQALELKRPLPASLGDEAIYFVAQADDFTVKAHDTIVHEDVSYKVGPKIDKLPKDGVSS